MKTLHELREELKELRESNRAAWDMYGSELCAGDMIGQEEYIKKQIKKLEDEKWSIKS